MAKIYSVLGGCIASLPSVNVRPCIINVNPPESRGAALTGANLFVTLGRGIGPCCITVLGSVFAFSRQSSFNITLSFFWTISATQFLFLANTLPKDQDRMEDGLVRYAAAAQGDYSTVEDGELTDHDHQFYDDNQPQKEQLTMSPIKSNSDVTNLVPPKTPVRRISVEEDDDLYNAIMTSPSAQYMTIDGKSARQSIKFVKLGIQEFGDEITHRNAIYRGCDTISPCPSLNEKLTSPSAADAIGDSPAAAAGTNGVHGNTSNARGMYNNTSALDDDDEMISKAEMQHRRDTWMRQQQEQ